MENTNNKENSRSSENNITPTNFMTKKINAEIKGKLNNSIEKLKEKKISNIKSSIPVVSSIPIVKTDIRKERINDYIQSLSNNGIYHPCGRKQGSRRSLSPNGINNNNNNNNNNNDNRSTNLMKRSKSTNDIIDLERNNFINISNNEHNKYILTNSKVQNNYFNNLSIKSKSLSPQHHNNNNNHNENVYNKKAHIYINRDNTKYHINNKEISSSPILHRLKNISFKIEKYNNNNNNCRFRLRNDMFNINQGTITIKNQEIKSKGSLSYNLSNNTKNNGNDMRYNNAYDSDYNNLSSKFNNKQNSKMLTYIPYDERENTNDFDFDPLFHNNEYN